jgi:hypothetical protein
MGLNIDKVNDKVKKKLPVNNLFSGPDSIDFNVDDIKQSDVMVSSNQRHRSPFTYID